MRLVLSVLLAFAFADVSAQWNGNTSINNAVCSFASNQTVVQMTSDGSGGAICTWVDTRNGTQDIYAQLIGPSGALQWPADGVVISNAPSDQFTPRLASDGNGGAIITWYDNRNGNWDIYAQRINASGVVQWTTDGVSICTVAGDQASQQLMADGAGGAIIVWSDGRAGNPNADIYAQRIDASGTVLWTEGGVPVCNASSLQNIPHLVSDGAGGAIIAWEDWRSFSQTDIYAQRISANGFTSWSFNGVVICADGSFANQYSTKLISDGNGGAIISWLDNRNSGSNTDIYTQKVNSSGVTQWLNNGLPVCTAGGLQLAQQIVSDGAGGAIIAWEDRRTNRNIYSQRFNSSGIAQWTTNGIPVCNEPSAQGEPQLAARASGGALISWTDWRNNFQEDIYVQAIDVAGAGMWTPNGVPVCNEAHSQFGAQLIPDGTDGAIVVWQDLRNTLDYDIYSSRLFANGTLPLRLISFSAGSNKTDVLLTWDTDNELNSSHFDTEFSIDGMAFIKLGEVRAKNTAGRNRYSFTHFSPAGNALFYRLKQVDLDNKFTYSKTVKVTMDKSTHLELYPNPASNFIQLKNARPDEMQLIQVINSDGRIVMENKANNQMMYDIGHLRAGIYILRLLKKDQSVSINQFIKK
jgi:hypothetical protein